MEKQKRSEPWTANPMSALRHIHANSIRGRSRANGKNFIKFYEKHIAKSRLAQLSALIKALIHKKCSTTCWMLCWRCAKGTTIGTSNPIANAHEMCAQFACHASRFRGFCRLLELPCNLRRCLFNLNWLMPLQCERFIAAEVRTMCWLADECAKFHLANSLAFTLTRVES